MFINSERRIGVTRKVRKVPGQALSDFNIFKLIAHHWGCADLFREWIAGGRLPYLDPREQGDAL